jgi:hypothetical protein
MLDNVYDCSCSGGIIYNIVQCKSCGCSCDASGVCTSADLTDITQKRIWNTVRVPASEYVMNMSSLTSYQTPSAVYNGVNWNQMSDRALPSNLTRKYSNVVPSRGNSTRYSLTRDRPGSQAPGGKGVDIKHGSYARYLARLKGKGPLRTQNATGLIAKQGNKTKSYGIVKSRSCLCFTSSSLTYNELFNNHPPVYYH